MNSPDTEKNGILGKNRIIKESGIVLISNGIKLFAGFVAFIIFSRVLGSSALGVFAAAVSLAEIVNELFEFGLDTAVIAIGAKYVSDGRRERLASIIQANLLVKLLTGVFLVAVGALLSGTIAELVFQNPGFKDVVFIGFCAIPGLMVFDVALSIFRMEQSFPAYAFLRGGSALLLLSAVSALAISRLLTLKTALLVYIVIVPAVSGIAGLVFRYKKYKGPASGLKASAEELANFGKWVYLGNVTESLRLRINNFLLIKFSSAASVGFYYTADKLSEALGLISTTVTTLLLPKASSLTSKDELRRFVAKSMKMISLVSVPLLLVIPFSGEIITFIFGNEFADAEIPFNLIYVSIIIEIICKPMLFAIFSMGDSRVIFRQNVITLLVLLVSAYFTIPAYAATGAALSLLLARIFGNGYVICEGYVKMVK